MHYVMLCYFLSSGLGLLICFLITKTNQKLCLPIVNAEGSASAFTTDFTQHGDRRAGSIHGKT